MMVACVAENLIDAADGGIVNRAGRPAQRPQRLFVAGDQRVRRAG